MREIGQEEGIRGLFRGHSATLLRIFPYAAIKFLAYEQIRARIIKDHTQETPLRRLVSGSLAGVTSVFFTYPLEVIRVRLAFETKADSKNGFVRICREIYHERPPIPQTASSATGSSVAAKVVDITTAHTPRAGLANFYRGFTPTMCGMLPYAGTSFLAHDTMGDLLRHPSIARYTTVELPEGTPAGKTARLTNPAELVAGATAGLVSQTASYPLEVLRRRMQVGGAVGDGHRLGMKETALKIMQERGLGGFFVGLTIGYIKVVPMAAVSFLVYERSKLALGI
jgi:solute carrier family 25 protein 16